MTIIKTVKYNKKDVLVLQTAFKSRAFAQTKISKFLSEQGFVLTQDGKIEPWTIKGTFLNEEDERILMYGDYFDGKSLLQIIHEDKQKAWETLHSCFLLIQKSYFTNVLSYEQLKNIVNAGPDAIIIGKNNDILFLPCEVYTRSLASYGQTKEITNRYLWIHPDYNKLDPVRALTFLFGTLAYKIIANTTAYELKTGDEQRTNLSNTIRNNLFEPIDFACWSIRPEIAYEINNMLNISIATSLDTILAYGKNFDQLIDQSKLHEQESSSFIKKRKMLAKKRKNKERFKNFTRKYLKTMVVSFLALSFIGFIIGITVKEQKEKPNTLGLEPLEVVEGFYKAIENLDQEITKLYSIKGFKTDYDSFITNLYVTSKVRETYERNGGIMHPFELFEKKDTENRTVYGITGLQIDLIQKTDNEERFVVSHYLWLPIIREVGDKNFEELYQETAISIYKYTETITVSFEKDRWLVSDIEAIFRTALNLNGDEILKAIKDDSALVLPWAMKNNYSDAEQ